MKKFLQGGVRATLCLLAIAVCSVNAKLVVYGPQDLIDKFNAATREPNQKSK